MEGIPNCEDEPKSLRPEHLAEGFKPIMTCVGTHKEYSGEIAEFMKIKKGGTDVNFFSNTAELKNQDFKNAGYQSYVISSVDSDAKFTRTLRECTSIVAVGQEIGTGKQLSLLTHQYPKEFLTWKNDKFTEHMSERLEELKKRCVPGSIDIVIAGGAVATEDPDYTAMYQKSLEVLDGIVQKELGFTPMVVSGPKSGGRDDVYLDTQNRRLYVVRPEESILHNNSFKADESEDMRGIWRKEEKEHEE